MMIYLSSEKEAVNQTDLEELTRTLTNQILGSSASYDFNETNTPDYDFKHAKSLDVLLINARSLLPKIESMVETMQEIDCEISIVTETWFQAGKQLDNNIKQIRADYGYEVIKRDRQTTRGGGMAIVYKKGDIIMSEIKTSGKYEIVASIARRSGQRRKLATIAVYIPPSYTAEQNKDCLEYVNSLVSKIKQKYNAPYILIAGDFNRKRIEHELRNYPDIKLTPTPPTRGRHHLDLILTNFDNYIERAGVMDPIINQDGQETDHKTVYLKANIPRVPNYTVKEYTYLRQTKKGDTKLRDRLNNMDWTVLERLPDPESMVRKLHEVFKTSMEECYTRMTRKKKSSEPAWMDETVRKLIARRRAIYREGKKTDR